MLALAVAAAALAACPVERGSYVLRGQPDITARFHPAPVDAEWRGGLALAIGAARTRRTYWALPWNGGTDGRQHVRWVRAPGHNLPADYRLALRDSDFLATDADRGFLPAVPKRGDVAPAHLLLPWIGGEVWHSTVDANRDAIPRAFLDLVAYDARDAATALVTLPVTP